MNDVQTSKKYSWLPIIVALVAGGCYIAGKYVETRGMVHATISVNGEGKVTAVPDIATLNFGVETGRKKTSQAATENLSTVMNEVIQAVKAEGIEEKDIRTQSLRLNPAYDWNDGERKLKGYEAHQSVQVKVQDPDTVGAVLSAATLAGANQVGGVSFTIDDPDELKAKAREAAIKDAKQKAKKLAKELGVKLGKLQGFYENEHPGPMPYETRMMMDAVGRGGGAEPLPVPSGEQDVSVHVTLTYEVK